MTLTLASAPVLDDDRATVPGSAVLVARLGGTAALLAAAAISASTLYHLGLRVGLVPTTAWLLPAALDIYAACAIFTGYRIPPEHPARASALRNARTALGLTVGCNALDQVLVLAGGMIPPVVRDGLLVAVASLPPLIVERLLHLQTLLVPGRSNVRRRDSQLTEENGCVHDIHERLDPRNDRDGQDDQDDQPERVDHDFSRVDRGRHPVVPAHSGLVHSGASDGAGPASGGVADPHRRHRATGREPSAQAAGHHLEPAVLTDIGAPVYRELAEQFSRRPGERVFQQALADRIIVLADDGQLPAGTRTPSLSTAKRVRALIEAAQTASEQAGDW